MTNETDILLQRYEEIVTSWRLQHIDDRDRLATVLADYRIDFSYNSGHIENEAITYHDTREVFESGRAIAFTGDVRTLFEVQNQKYCHELILDAFAEKRALDEGFVLEVHGTLTQGTYDERRWMRGERPGRYKVHDYVIGPDQVGAPPEETASEVRELLQELDVVTSENVLTAAAYFHLAFEAIHPFADGNGRVGRTLMNYLLIRNDHPPVIVYDEDKYAYYGAIQVWDDEGDLGPMRDFLRAETVKTWRTGLRWP